MGDNGVNAVLKKKRIGESNYNIQGQHMEIINYTNYLDITILFEDGSIREHAPYSCFKDGSLKNYNTPDVYGVGISGYKKKKVNGKLTKEYGTWVNILQRCYDKEKQNQFPHYKGCSISKEWIRYDNFYEWCHNQSNWKKVIENPSNFHIDKDIIQKGNKIYGANFCSFVPANVNTLFVKNNKARGKLPIGVTEDGYGKYRARCSMKLIDEKDAYKLFNTPEEGFLFYKENKERLIKEVAKKEFNNGNITKECYEAMMKYKVEITD